MFCKKQILFIIMGNLRHVAARKLKPECDFVLPNVIIKFKSGSKRVQPIKAGRIICGC